MKNNNEFYNTEIKQKFLKELEEQNKEYQLYICLFHTTQKFESVSHRDLAEFDKSQYEHLFIENNWIVNNTFTNKYKLIQTYVNWYKNNIDSDIEYSNTEFNYSEVCSYANFGLMYYKDILDLMQNVRDVFSDDNFDDAYILNITVLLGLLFYNLDFDEIDSLTNNNFLVPDEICLNNGRIVFVNNVFYRACLRMFDYTQIKARTIKYLQDSPYLIRRSYSLLSYAQNDKEKPDSKFMYNNRRKNWKDQFEKLEDYSKGKKMNKTSLAHSGLFSSIYNKGLTKKEDICNIISQYTKSDTHESMYTTYLSWRKYFHNE